MSGLDHGAVERVDPAAHAHQTPLVVLDGDALGLEQPAIARPDGDGEVLAPVVAEVEVAAPPYDRRRLDPPLDQLEAMESAVGLVRSAHPIARLRPDAETRGTRTMFDDKHLGDRRTVVDQAVDPRESGREQRTLNPGSVVTPHQMRPQPAVTVPRNAARCQADPAALNQTGERLPCCLREQLHAGGGVAGNVLRRLDAGEAHPLPVFEQDRDAVDDLDHPCFRVERKARQQRQRRLARGATRRHGENEEKDHGESPPWREYSPRLQPNARLLKRTARP